MGDKLKHLKIHCGPKVNEIIDFTDEEMAEEEPRVEEALEEEARRELEMNLTGIGLMQMKLDVLRSLEHVDMSEEIAQREKELAEEIERCFPED